MDAAEVGRRSAWRVVHSGDAPAVTHAGTVDPVDAGDRAILDREGERGFGVEIERQRQGGADRAAMRHGDDVASGMGFDQPVNCRDTRSMTATKLSPAGGVS